MCLREGLDACCHTSTTAMLRHTLCSWLTKSSASWKQRDAQAKDTAAISASCTHPHGFCSVIFQRPSTSTSHAESSTDLFTRSKVFRRSHAHRLQGWRQDLVSVGSSSGFGFATSVDSAVAHHFVSENENHVLKSYHLTTLTIAVNEPCLILQHHLLCEQRHCIWHCSWTQFSPENISALLCSTNISSFQLDLSQWTNNCSTRG